MPGKGDQQPLAFYTFQELWTELMNRFDAAILLVLVNKGRPDEMMRQAKSGGTYLNIGMLAAAHSVGLKAIAPMDVDKDSYFTDDEEEGAA